MTQDTTINAWAPGKGNSSTADLALIQRRLASLGPAYRLFYETPLHLVKGEGLWLWDDQGRRYLDCYNNVASVGHCHPKVVAAMASQAGLLATHTRYLHEGILNYAERLLQSFPTDIGHVMFTCTGSEANDLALRIARAVTGGVGVIVTENAYHGVTLATSGMSMSVGPAVAPGADVFAIPAPTLANYPAGVALGFAGAIRAACQKMRDKGIQPAMLILDTIFASDGLICDPAGQAEGFLAPAAAAIRAEGGLFVADEVQPGFGRTGRHMWGFQRHGVVPDMVSMGKPMGNGYPIAALALQPRHIEAFGAKARYFNTFGGNAVAAATANAVLSVIEDEKLMANAQNTGAILLEGLKSLGDIYGSFGECRGAGLFLAADIIDAQGQPDPAKTNRIVNALRQEGVLISASGARADSLKIRPPLPFGPSHAQIFLETLERVLKREG